MELKPTTQLGPLLEQYPFLIDFLAGYAPKFKVIRNPIMRKTVARAATLEQAAKLGGVELDGLLRALAEAISEEAEEEVTLAPAGAPEEEAPVPAGEERRLEELKGIILSLHEGGDVEEARRRFAEVIRDVTPAEISAMEQRLIAEGLPAEEVKRLCDVHVRVFEESLERREAPEVPPGHPVHTFRLESEAVAAAAAAMRDELGTLGERPGEEDLASRRRELDEALARVAEVEKHYLRKENQLFPLLERHGVSGPSQVMWSLDDDIRAMLRETRQALAAGEGEAFVAGAGRLLAAVDDMIYKEEKILLPMALETLSAEEWREVRRGEEDIGYALVAPAAPWPPEGEVAAAEPPAEPEPRKALPLDTGALASEQVNLILKHLPADLTFVDEEDVVRYYSAGAERIFPRSPAVIGRKVQNCHPPKSLYVVERILEEFKAGRRDVAAFWIRQGERFVYIRYFALRDAGGAYRGTLEVSEDVTDARALEGERRLLDWQVGSAPLPREAPGTQTKGLTSMLSDKMQKALNGQLNAELYSAYLYLSMAAYFAAEDLPGFTNWMRVQVQEELVHAVKFFDFINERDGRVTLGSIEGPPTVWDSPRAAFEHVVQHERKVTGLINELVTLAAEEKDHATHNFLQWFVAEQVEEESSANGVLQKVKLAGDTGGGMLMVDNELATRVFTPPPGTGAGKAPGAGGKPAGG